MLLVGFFESGVILVDSVHVGSPSAGRLIFILRSLSVAGGFPVASFAASVHDSSLGNEGSCG